MKLAGILGQKIELSDLLGDSLKYQGHKSLTLVEESLQGDAEAQKQYEWILLELFDQMVRNVSGGEMLKYLKQDPVPAASFALERMGSEVSKIMGSNQNSKIKHIKRSEAKMVLKPEGIGRFRLSGEIH